MSLTVYIGNKQPEVVIVRSFREPSYPNSYIEYFSGKPVKMSLKQFRSIGVQFVKDHFRIYETARLAEKDIIPVFKEGEARALLKGRTPLSIGPDYFADGKGLRLCALRFRKYELGGLVDRGEEYHRCLPRDWRATQFWECFDQVFEDAS